MSSRLNLYELQARDRFSSRLRIQMDGALLNHEHDLVSLRARNMICFSHDWRSDPLSKTHLMRLLARENRVLWVNSIGNRTPTVCPYDLKRAFKKLMSAALPLAEVEPNIHVLNPLVVPVYGRPWATAFNRQFLRLQVRLAMRRLGFERPINWVFNPAADVVAGHLGEETLIYYCVDEFPAFSGVCRESLARMERQLIEKADMVFVSSDRLRQSKGSLHPRTVLVRHGVDWAHYRRALDPRTAVPAELARLPGPVIGYFGLIAQDWVDLDLIAHVSRALPYASIVMIGNITMDVSRLKALKNVHLLGHRPYQLLPDYCRGFDAAMIPFPINDVTLHSNPLKLREYLAAGLPVVSTAIPEVESLGRARIGRSHNDFVDQIRLALLDPGPSRARSDAMRDQSWEARISQIASHVAAVARQPARRARQNPARAAWPRRFPIEEPLTAGQSRW